MIRYFEKLRIDRNRKRDKVDSWKNKVLSILFDQIIPTDEPFYYDSAFSFLQRDRKVLDNPIRVCLFLPTFPLAIDIVGADGHPNYTESKPYITRGDWEELQSDLSMKAQAFGKYHCPYLIIRDVDPIDAYNLKDRVRSLTGRRLR